MKFQLWLQRFKERKDSGLTVKEYCKKNNLSEKTYFYWHHKAVMMAYIQNDAVSVPAEEVVDQTGNNFQPEFVSVPLNHSGMVRTSDRTSAAQIHIGDAVIDISDDISDELLLRILKAVSHV